MSFKVLKSFFLHRILKISIKREKDLSNVVFHARKASAKNELILCHKYEIYFEFMKQKKCLWN